MTDGKILLVDDEPDILNLLEEVLRRDGLRQIARAETGAGALAACREFAPDVVVLDVMLPDMDGLDVCRSIRAFSACSILFLSSKSEEIDKILGLSCGGDDYVAKPFSPREVAYRVKAQLRRQQYAFSGGTLLRAGPLSVDEDGGRAYLGERELELTGREFLLLACLVRNAGRIVSKERLYEQVWGEASAICDNTIMVHIRHLREKIEDDPSHPQLLVTVKGLGYKLRRGNG